MQILLERRADLEARMGKQWTPLHIAPSQGHTEIIEILLKNNADLEAKDSGWFFFKKLH